MSDEYIDISDINTKSIRMTETDKFVKDFIDNIPDGMVSTPDILADKLEMSRKYIRTLIRAKFPDNIKISSLSKKTYIGKKDVLDNLR